MPRFFIIIVIDFSMILGISKGGEKKRNISCPDTRISKLHQTRSFLFWNDEKTIVKRIIGRRRLFPIFSRKRKGKEREREKDASSHVYVFCKTTQKFCLNENRSFSKGHAILRNGFYWKKRKNVVTRQCGVFVQRFRSCTADPRIRLDLQWKGFDETRKKKETGKRFLFLFAGMKQSYVNKFGVVTLLQIVQDRSIVEIS